MASFSREEFNELWNNSEIIIDTSVLGLILQSNPKQSKIMMDLFRYRVNDIWIPAQVKDEFTAIQRNPRVEKGAIDRLHKFYGSIQSQLQTLQKSW